MAVCKMQRMNICGMQEKRKAILERLQAAGAMEINVPDTGRSLHQGHDGVAPAL